LCKLSRAKLAACVLGIPTIGSRYNKLVKLTPDIHPLLTQETMPKIPLFIRRSRNKPIAKKL
jgi:hypothetical protein